MPKIANTNILLFQKFDTELNNFRELLGRKKIGQFESNLKSDILNLLQTDAIQLLDKRFQLGLIYKVSNGHSTNAHFNKATHTRLDHTIGVVAKCLITADIINENNPGNFDEKDVRELVAAAALHDCGHFPISHATERGISATKGLKKGIKHEENIIPLIIGRGHPKFEKSENYYCPGQDSMKIPYIELQQLSIPKMA